MSALKPDVASRDPAAPAPAVERAVAPEAALEAPPGSAPDALSRGPAFAGTCDTPYWLHARAAPTARRVLPSLFDRLCSQPPLRPPSLREQREQLRACVLRDLQVLLNAANHEHLLRPLLDAAAAASCWNYGACAPAGAFVGGDTWQRIEKGIRDAILRFEPRIVADSLSVQALQDPPGRPRHNLLRFAITGCIHDVPQALAFSVHTTIDLETRRVQLHTGAAGRSARET